MNFYSVTFQLNVEVLFSYLRTPSPVANQDIFTELSVFLHLSFIFTGAKAGGAAGFFKGLGKGVVGVVARPAGGLVDFASSTFEGIKGLVTFQNLTPF